MSRGSTGQPGPAGIIIICWTGILKRGTGGPGKKWPLPGGGASGGGGCGGGSPNDAAGLAAPPTLPTICVSRINVTRLLMLWTDHASLHRTKTSHIHMIENNFSGEQK